jgi:monoamine oxidase
MRVDVIVIGAGLAGATAALELRDRGLSVCVVEARERVGGRGHARAFLDSADVVDVGGAWITPWQTRIRTLCARYGIGLTPRPPIRERRWFRDDALHRDGPTSVGDRAGHERTIARMAADAALLKLGHALDEKGRPIAGISYADYMRRLDPPKATLDLFSAWWTVSGNGDKARVPVSELLGSAAYSGPLAEGMIDVWADTLDGGVERLVATMLATLSPGAVELGVPVTDVATVGDGVSVMLMGGRVLGARAAILSTGLNPLGSIRFDPPLPPHQAAAVAEGHGGRCVKVWAKVRGVPPGILATGGGTGLEFMVSDRLALDGSTLIVGFGVAANGWTPNLPRDVEDAVARFFPEAEFLAADWHDWNVDPFARGAWVAALTGVEERFTADFWPAGGTLAFASSDFAAGDAGWFEGAAVSGEAAALALAMRLQASP